MALNSLSPAFVKINYASAFGIHVMTVPSVPVNPDNANPGEYDFDLRGAALDVRANTAVADYVNVTKAFFPASVIFIDAQLYAQPTPTSAPTLLKGFALNIAGTSALGAIPTKATQWTWTYRADDNTIFKQVFLDCAMDNFEKGVSNTGYAAGTANVNYVTAQVTWIASRGGGRPTTFLQRSATLNEKLRRAYNMT